MAVGCWLLAVGCWLLAVAIGLKHFSINGDFIWPLTVPHLSVNTLNVSRAVVGVCLIDFDLWLYSVCKACLMLMFVRIAYKLKKCQLLVRGFVAGD